MRTELPVDDLRVGQYTTILKGPIYPESSEVGNLLTGQVITKAAFEDHSWQGDVLQIIAIDLPFVAVNACKHNWPLKFDIRRGWIFKELSKEYIAALKKKS